MKTNQKAIGILSAIALGFCLVASGENELSGKTVVDGNGKSSTESLVSDGLQKNLVSTSNITDNSVANSQNGREYKAGDAQRQANAGKAAAIATGVGLVATATPMLASIIPSVRAAGAVLMAKAGLEFAQAAASGGVANQNGDQKKLLKADDGQSGSQNGETEKGSASKDGGASAEAAKQLQNNPQLQDLLSKQGVNSDDFINRLASGEITNPEQVLSSAGSEPVSSGDIAAASNANFINGNPEPNGIRDTTRVVNDDNAKLPATDGAKDGAGAGLAGIGGAGGVGAGLPGAAGGLSGTKLGDLAAAAGAGKGGPVDSARKALQDALAAAGGLDGSGLLGGISGLFTTSGAGGARRAMTTDELLRVGIVKLAPKQNIFMLAHRNYRAFHKWRKGDKPKRVAKNP